MKCTVRTLSIRSASRATVVSCGPMLQRSRVTRCQRVVTRAQADEEIEEVPPDIWDSPAIGIAVQIGFSAIVVAAIAAVLALGKPVVDYTFSVFPTGAASQEGLYSP